jgi:hypothetical protein
MQHRLVRDYEQTEAGAEAWIYIVSVSCFADWPDGSAFTIFQTGSEREPTRSAPVSELSVSYFSLTE